MRMKAKRASTSSSPWKFLRQQTRAHPGSCQPRPKASHLYDLIFILGLLLIHPCSADIASNQTHVRSGRKIENSNPPMLAVPVSSRLDEHKNPSNTSSEAGEEAKEQKVIELCRFSDTPLCQLYFELYSRIEALPAVVEQLDDPQGPVQLQSNYGHKIGSTPLLVHGTLGRDPSRTTPPAPQAIGLGKQIWMGNNTTTTTQGTKGPIVHLHLDDAVDFYNASSETLQANKSWTNTDLEGHGSRLSEVRVLPPEGFYFIDQDDPLLGGVGEETRTQNTRQIQRRMLGLGPRGKRKTSTKFSGLLQGKRASATSNDLDKSKAKPKDAQRRFGGFKKSREPNFPTYNSIPRTRFNCKHAPEGYHADPEAHCQVRTREGLSRSWS
eukprot:TCALIF_07923-PA protein Name:"Protein of unknown function" AED:0.32 eAED:0.32 QI:21/1/0.66/1/0.5/0.66/3/0/380